MAEPREGGRRGKGRLAWALLGAALAVVVAAVLVSDRVTPAPLGDVQVGSDAPDFCLDAVQGGAYCLSELLAEGKVVLLSFLNTQAEAGGATADPSRSQVVLLRTVEIRCSSESLQVLIVDAASTVTGRYPTGSDLAGFVDDWSLDTIPVLVDDRARTVARAYGVTGAPTTFLIATNGVVEERWEGLEIFPLWPGLPLHPYFCDPVPWPTHEPRPGLSSTPAFPCDATPARALSDNIWVVDAGRSWDSGEGVVIPLTWVILGAEGDVHLEVALTDPETGASEQLVDADVSPIPEDEAAAMLVVMPDAEPKVHLHYARVSVTLNGCLQVQAVVTREGDETPLLEGEATIPVNPPCFRRK